ncbi:DDE-type integrase/transposase/recombinase [Oculatella sp. FACHB-28]|nr:DDE-type integrase/transposase/recombinase [Oculatella sp. FACHB-28]MBD2068848.1 DDE-type integrase/transposase/recombinase [Leptolyngbya sp. FACHB-671]
MITVDKNVAYPVAIEAMRADDLISVETELRQSKYLNNGIEQDYTDIKPSYRSNLWNYRSF